MSPSGVSFETATSVCELAGYLRRLIGKTRIFVFSNLLPALSGSLTKEGRVANTVQNFTELFAFTKKERNRCEVVYILKMRIEMLKNRYTGTV